MHHWKNLVFEISNVDDRAKFIAKNGAILPLTHETNPLVHAEKCLDFMDGELFTDCLDWKVSVLVPIEIDKTLVEAPDGEGLDSKPHTDVDFTTLGEAITMMQHVDAHVRAASSRPAAEKPSQPPPKKPKTPAKRRR